MDENSELEPLVELVEQQPEPATCLAAVSSVVLLDAALLMMIAVTNGLNSPNDSAIIINLRPYTKNIFRAYST
jgi:hypothetical protein